jgi:hypothetical protein
MRFESKILSQISIHSVFVIERKPLNAAIAMGAHDLNLSNLGEILEAAAESDSFYYGQPLP